MKRKQRTIPIFVLLAVAGIFKTLPGQEGVKPAGFGIGVRLHGGINYLQGGDANSGLQGLYDWILADAVNAGYATQGNFKALHQGFDGGAALLIHFGRRFGLALGVDYLRATQESPLSINSPLPGQYTIVSEVTATPLKLGLFCTVPLGRTLNLMLQAGAGYYWTRFFYENSLTSSSGTDRARYDVTAAGPGAHTSLALEISLTRKIFLFLEASGRYAPISGYQGEEQDIVHGTVIYSANGTLYHLKLHTSVGDFWLLELDPTPPSGPEYSNVREAKIDFSGLSLNAGLRVRF